MPLDPAPLPTAPSIRQQTVVQPSSPSREVQVNMPLESLSTSRVLIVVFTTISGGTKSHIPSSQLWSQVPLMGAGGYASFGNTMASAWVSRPGSTVYQAGSFKFAGLVGLAPEYSTALAFEITDTQNGAISLSGQSWNSTYSNQITGQSPAMGQRVRGVLAVGYAEGEHTFTEPPGDQGVLTQTAASGFFTAPFSVVGSYATQNSNDPSDVTLPFEGVASKAGVLLFNAISANNSIVSNEIGQSVTSVLALPGASVTTDAFVGYGGTVTYTTDADLSFDPMTVMSSSDSLLSGTPTAFQTVGSQTYLLIDSTHSVDSKIEVFNVVSHNTDAGLLSTVSSTHTTDAKAALSPMLSHNTDAYVLGDLHHSTDSYVFAGQTSHSTDALLMQTNSLTHTTNALAVYVNNSLHTTDSYLQPLPPPTQSHTADSLLTQDNIIGMTGWELQGDFVECDPDRTPNYSLPAGTLATSSSAKRPGSQGTYGLRIDNQVWTESFWVPQQSSKSLQDMLPTYDFSSQAKSVFSDMWTSFYFRCLDRPTASSEMLIADLNQQIGVASPPFSTPIYGYCYWIALGNSTLSGVGGGLQLGHGPYNPASPDADYILSDTNWHYLEVRTYTASGVVLYNANPMQPVTIQVYLDGNLIMSTNSYIPCLCASAIGIQERLTSERFRVDYDDLVLSTNRLNLYDLSVIAKPAKADGTYTAWTGTPSNTYTDVASIPYDTTKHFDSSAVNQVRTVKVYSGADANPYPGHIHAVSLQAVHKFNTSSSAQNVAVVVREGGTDATVKTWRPTSAGGKVYIALTTTFTKSPVAGADWPGTIYDFEVGVKQVVDSNANRVVGISANLLVSPFSYDHTADAMLFGTVDLTHTTDADIGRVAGHTTDSFLTDVFDYHYADSRLFGLIDATHQTDAMVFGQVDQTHDTDAYLDRSLSHTTDAVIVDVRGSVHTTDSALVDQLDLSHDTDSTIGALVDRPHYTDALQFFLKETSHFADAMSLANPILTHLADARKIAAVSATHTADSLKKATITATNTTDALKYSRVDLTHLTDALKLGSPTLTFTVNSYLQPTNTLALFHTAVASLRSTFSAAHTTDALLKIFGFASHTTNSILMGSSQDIHTADSWIVIPASKTLTHTSDADLQGSRTASETSDALLKATNSLTFSTNSWIQLIGELQHTANSLIGIVPTHTHQTNSVLWSSFTVAASSDALVRNSYSLGHTTDAKIVATYSPTYSTDADIWIFPVSPYITHNSASSLSGSAQNTHTTDALAYFQLTVAHTTSSAVQGQVDLTFNTNSDLLGSPTLQWLTDAKLAAEALHTTDSDTAGNSGVTHGAEAYLINDDTGIFEPEQGMTFDGAF